MDKEAVQKRLEQLKLEREQLAAQINQLTANMHAYDGAIQDCEFWIAQDEPKEE